MALLREFKASPFFVAAQASAKPIEAPLNAAEKRRALSQSELHLKAILKERFNDDADLETNIRSFVALYPLPEATASERFIAQAITMIEYERNHPELTFYYHGCGGNIAFVYDLYTEVYRQLQACDHYFLRADHVLFNRLHRIDEFMSYFADSNGCILNFNNEFRQLAISANLFLFGNHENSPSYSPFYYLRNTSCWSLDIADVLKSIFEPMGIDQEFLNKIAQDHPAHLQGVLYQIAYPHEVAAQLSYAAHVGGTRNPLKIYGRLLLSPQK